MSRGVAGIGSASFLADVGHEIPTALLPSLLTSTLGAPAAALGAIEGISDALAGAARFAGGALADDPHRRRTVAVGGYTTTAVLGAATAVATSVWQVGVLRAAAWTTRGLRVPARNALLADIVPAAAYGRAYGFERMMDNLGAIFGPLLAIALVAHHRRPRGDRPVGHSRPARRRRDRLRHPSYPTPSTPRAVAPATALRAGEEATA
ncbi:hypothetical protein Acor_54530 [Acrocarpospora corrugata]|uniref:Major facilitator superfamily (MFS) profile domain-containing protein n=2 Tax=Acrocarpospora corrugata TaxID=35763 RepID=A0A5M3W2T6_9ACTN|nr:hypothetical protein Acor_54530 [Acrocarpospora corrugata]